MRKGLKVLVMLGLGLLRWWSLIVEWSLSAIRVSDWVSWIGLIGSDSSISSIGCCWSVERGLEVSVERGEIRCEGRLRKYCFDLLSRIAISNKS